ncbi:MAG: hypothetical protein L6266_04730 [Nanoarchaeota archaeon]|nr:hypothetical protein [Nanoarchaeota archaeon]
MKQADYAECVYRLARICEVKGIKSQGESSEPLKLNFWDSEKISMNIGELKDFYFNTITSFLEEKYNKVQLSEISDGEETKKEYREGPVVIFPEVEIKVNRDTFVNRNCNTVCMGANRSKIWVRLSLNKKKKDSEAVRRFYGKAESLAGVVCDAVFHCYKSILKEKGFDLKEVYNINVVGATSTKKEVGSALQKLHDPNETIKNLFSNNEALLNSSCDVIFPYFGLEKKITDVTTYKSNKLTGFDWISVDDPITKETSIFLSKDSGTGKNASTSFVGLGYNSPRKNEHVMRKATKDILTLISPNI